MSSWHLRLAGSADADVLSELSKRTFRETFTHYPEEEVAAFLEENYTPEFFIAALRDPDTRMWMAEENGRAVAYAKLGAYKLPLPPAQLPVMELHRLYVLQAYRGKGIGAALLQEALAAAVNGGTRSLYLGVWKHNRKAQAFYAHYGFVKVGEYNYPPIGQTVDREWIMLKRL
jgi:ribosomal protein S18 acetylase RimI-like enzyme